MDPQVYFCGNLKFWSECRRNKINQQILLKFKKKYPKLCDVTMSKLKFKGNSTRNFAAHLDCTTARILPPLVEKMLGFLNVLC